MEHFTATSFGDYNADTMTGAQPEIEAPEHRSWSVRAMLSACASTGHSEITRRSAICGRTVCSNRCTRQLLADDNRDSRAVSRSCGQDSGRASWPAGRGGNCLRVRRQPGVRNPDGAHLGESGRTAYIGRNFSVRRMDGWSACAHSPALFPSAAKANGWVVS